MCILITIVMKDLWNEICFDLSECKRRNVLEKDYENAIVQCLAILGWKKYLGEIATQYPIQVGHEKKRADIVVSSNGIAQFVIEVKKPNHTIYSEAERQISSYVLQLKCMFGLYIGDDIRLYYNDMSSHSHPEPLFVVDITKDNPDGVRFVELFAKESFDIEKLQEFCRQKKEDLNKEQKIKEEIEMLLSGNGKELFRRLYCEDCISKGLEEDFANRVLEKISVNFLSKDQQANTHDWPDLHKSTPVDNVWEDHLQKKTTSQPKRLKRYSLNKSNPLGCGRLALAIVRQYVKENPHLTYKEIQQRLPSCATIGTWKEIEQESTTRHDPRFMSRWFTRHEELMTSADKQVFALTTQWGANGPSPNILPMIDFARKQGYVVEEL